MVKNRFTLNRKARALVSAVALGRAAIFANLTRTRSIE